MYRLNLLYRGLTSPPNPCTVICENRVGSLTEYWLVCRDVYELMLAFEVFSSHGVVLAIGTLRGDVYRVLPGSLNEFIRALEFDMELQPGTDVLGLSFVDPVRGLEVLYRYVSSASVRRDSRIIKAVLSRAVKVSTFFDLGIRLLKPMVVPPILVKGMTLQLSGNRGSGKF